MCPCFTPQSLAFSLRVCGFISGVWESEDGSEVGPPSCGSLGSHSVGQAHTFPRRSVSLARCSSLSVPLLPLSSRSRGKASVCPACLCPVARKQVRLVGRVVKTARFALPVRCPGIPACLSGSISLHLSGAPGWVGVLLLSLPATQGSA